MKQTTVFQPLDSRRAEEYVRWQLEHYGDTLSQYGIGIDFQQGRFFAIAPSGSSSDELNELSPGLFADSAAEVENILLRYFRTRDERTETSVWLSEMKQNASGKYPELGCEWFRYRPSTYTTWDGSKWQDWPEGICIWMRTRDTTVAELLHSFFREFLWGTRIAFLVRDDTRMPEKGATVSAESMRDMILKTTSLIVPAYGGETYLVWSE